MALWKWQGRINHKQRPVGIVSACAKPAPWEIAGPLANKHQKGRCCSRAYTKIAEEHVPDRNNVVSSRHIRECSRYLLTSDVLVLVTSLLTAVTTSMPPPNGLSDVRKSLRYLWL